MPDTELTERRTRLRAAALVVAYSIAVLVLGVSATSLGSVGIVLTSLGSCGLVAGAGWGLSHARAIRRLTQLPAARVIQR